MAMQAELARCDAEIAEILTRPDVVAGLAPAWLVCLGVSDWEVEKRLISSKWRRRWWTGQRYSEWRYVCAHEGYLAGSFAAFGLATDLWCAARAEGLKGKQ